MPPSDRYSIANCNSCHKSTGFGYIVYELPKPAIPAKLDTGQTFTKEQLGRILEELVGKK